MSAVSGRVSAESGTPFSPIKRDAAKFATFRGDALGAPSLEDMTTHAAELQKMVRRRFPGLVGNRDLLQLLVRFL
jgi:hypothetical protein